ncbi:hypothetical protein [Aliarcobacter cryaerophilus]|uniref:hypothetical protein n=1 Tax=Aliarcobacter cryaerophilus TaxID=28198 RepID=UPI003DA272D2
MHDYCAQDISGAIPFCESCYNDISFSNKCPSCGEYELAVWNNGEACENPFCGY